MPLPILNGVRIMDLTHFLAGPAVTRLLGELGAEVIKVESIQHYDGSRSMTTSDEPDSHERSSVYNFFNTNKLGITLDLKNRRGVAAARELAKVCDAVLDNFPTGTMERLGLGEEALWSINPTLVIMSMAGYGQRGPWSKYPSFATSLAMMSGLYEISGHPYSEPSTPSIGGVDPMNGILGANALLMALMRRRRTGRGLRIDYAQLEATTTLVGEMVADLSVNGRVATRQGNRHPTAAPHGIYPCREDNTWMSIAVFGDEEFQRLCQVMGKAHLADDSRFADRSARQLNQPQLDDVISRWTGEQEQYQAVSALQARGITAGVVHSSKSVWQDPHLRERGVFEDVERAVTGKNKDLRPAFRFSNLERTDTRPAPTLGQHNRFVLARLLALPPEEIDALEREQVIGNEPLTTRI